MILVDAVPTIVPTITNSELMKHISFASKCELTEAECALLGQVLMYTEAQMVLDQIDIPTSMSVAIIFTDDRSVQIVEDDPSALGMHKDLIVYYMDRIRLADRQLKIVALTEELVHHFWRIEDETAVKYKVVEIAQFIDPSITIDLLREAYQVNGL